MSLDGRIALKNGNSKWITSKYARQDVQTFRAKSSAILSTSSTVLTDNPQLNIRTKELDKKILPIFPHKIFKHPIRVLIDSQNRIQLRHKIIQIKEPIWLIRLKSDQQLWPKHVTELIVKPYQNKINILSLFKILGTKEINNIWVESGSAFSGLLLKLGVIDEVIIYIAPIILGHNAKPLCILNNQIKLFECLKFKLKNFCKIGPDIRLIFQPKKNNII